MNQSPKIIQLSIIFSPIPKFPLQSSRSPSNLYPNTSCEPLEWQGLKVSLITLPHLRQLDIIHYKSVHVVLPMYIAEKVTNKQNFKKLTSSYKINTF